MGGVKSLTHSYTKNGYLYYHINRGDTEQIEEILKADPELIDKPVTPNTKVTPLVLAAFINNKKVTELLINNCQADPNKPSEKGETPLIAAIRRNHIDMVKFLLEKGADPNYEDNYSLKTI